MSKESSLLDRGTRVLLPPLYSGEVEGLDAKAVAKFFLPGSGWTWFASEGSPVDEDGYYDTDKEKVDFVFFGLVVGLETELGYFSLRELESVRSQLGLPVERDLDFEPTPLKQLLQEHRRR